LEEGAVAALQLEEQTPLSQLLVEQRAKAGADEMAAAYAVDVTAAWAEVAAAA
jgi:hypothetical protein